jgi:peptidoglycan/LPS O-acetylase OafA/YrhL
MLRALAAFTVFVYHWAEPYIPGFMPQGQLQVDAFFLAEGFLAGAQLAGVTNRRAAAGLILERLARVYVLYAIGLALGALVVLWAGVRAPAEIFDAFARGVILAPTLDAPTRAIFPLNPPSWAIVLELAGFAFLCLAHPLRGRLLLILCAAGGLLTLGLAVALHDNNMGWRGLHFWGVWPRLAFCFLGGVLIYQWRPVWEPRIPRLSPLVPCAIFLGALFLSLPKVSLPLLAFVLPATTVIAAACSAGPRFEAVGRLCRRYAYALYLIPNPVMTAIALGVVRLHVPQALAGSVLGFLVATLLVLAAVAAAVHLVDEPVRASLRSGWGRSRAIASADEAAE